MVRAPNHLAAPILSPLPPWARSDAPTTETGAAFRAGAALAVLDARVHADVRFAGVWRCRLALKADMGGALGAVTIKLERTRDGWVLR